MVYTAFYLELMFKVFISRYFVQNFDWLEEKLGDVEDDYILFDCPGKFSQLDSLNELFQTISSLDQSLVILFLIYLKFVFHHLSLSLSLLSDSFLCCKAIYIKSSQN